MAVKRLSLTFAFVPCRLLLHWTKMAAEPVVGFDSVPDCFHSHSFQHWTSEEKQDSVTHNVHSQQGGARSTARRAVGCVGGGSLAVRSRSHKRSEGPSAQTHR